MPAPAAIATVMLAISFLALLAINALQAFSRRPVRPCVTH